LARYWQALWLNDMTQEQPIKKILVIDDEYAIRVLLKNFLENNVYEIRLASSGEHVDEILDTFQPDLVITDIMMPAENGLSIVSRIRKKNPFIKVIYLSAWLDEPETERKLHEELINYPHYKLMQKPFDLNDLLNVIQTLSPLS